MKKSKLCEIRVRDKLLYIYINTSKTDVKRAVRPKEQIASTCRSTNIFVHSTQIGELIHRVRRNILQGRSKNNNYKSKNTIKL